MPKVVAVLFAFVLFFSVTASGAFAREKSTECGTPALLKNFPSGWTIVWERNIPLKSDGIEQEAFVVREYRSPDSWIGKYYLADYPGSLGVETLYVEAPGRWETTKGSPRSHVSGFHYFVRQRGVICWKEVEEFRVDVNANIIDRDLEFLISWKELAIK